MLEMFTLDSSPLASGFPQIKVPSFSETLSALNVVQVSGGSKSLFAGKKVSDC